jgi:hypothetical protein
MALNSLRSSSSMSWINSLTSSAVMVSVSSVALGFAAAARVVLELEGGQSSSCLPGTSKGESAEREAMRKIMLARTVTAAMPRMAQGLCRPKASEARGMGSGVRGTIQLTHQTAVSAVPWT